MNKSQKAKIKALKKSESVKTTIFVQALEPRILLDAAAASTFADAALDQVVNASVEDAIANLADSGVSQTSDNDSHVDAYNEYQSQSKTNELVIIDSSIAYPQEILNAIDPAAQVVFIDAGTDGIEQLADMLVNFDNVDALHIISHGEQGQLNLGTSTLTEQTMSGEYACLLYTSDAADE